MLRAAGRTILAFFAVAALTVGTATVADADDTVPAPVAVRGVVSDAVTKAPLAGVTVEWANPRTGKTAGATTTAADGSYTLATSTRGKLTHIAAGVPIQSRKYTLVSRSHVGVFAGADGSEGPVYQLLRPFTATPVTDVTQDFSLTQSGRFYFTDRNIRNGYIGLTAMNGVPVGKNSAQVGKAYKFTDLVPGRYKLACRTVHGWSVLQTATVVVKPGATTSVSTSAACITPPAGVVHEVPKHGPTAHITGTMSLGYESIDNLDLQMTRHGLASRSGYLYVSDGVIEDFTDVGEYWAAGSYTVSVWNDDRNVGVHSGIWSVGLGLPVGSPYWLSVPSSMATLRLTAGQHLNLGAVKLVLHS